MICRRRKEKECSSICYPHSYSEPHIFIQVELFAFFWGTILQCNSFLVFIFKLAYKFWNDLLALVAELECYNVK